MIEMPLDRFTRRRQQVVVHYPIDLETIQFVGPLRGFYHGDTGEYNIVAFGEDAGDGNFVGRIFPARPTDLSDPMLTGFRDENGLAFYAQGERCIQKPYQLVQNLFSRNQGILETRLMLRKSAVISGCGSVGSFVALELARAGLGNFLLVDNDTIAYHNLCRHQCDIHDVGKFKVSAVRERVMRINPTANVVTAASLLEDVPKRTFDDFCNCDTIIIGCADNRAGDLYANRLSHLYRMPFLSIGFWERAFAGELFYAIPGAMPCYHCAFGGETEVLSGRVSTNRRFYTTEEDIANTRFEPGISTDITFVSTIGVKLALDLLNTCGDIAQEGYHTRLLSHLTQFTLVCNTNNPRLGGELAEIFAYPLQVTTSIKIEPLRDCPVCGGRVGASNASHQ